MITCRRPKRKHSLFVKLFIIFTILEIAIFATFACSFKFFGTKPFKEVFHKNVSNYISYIIADIGIPVTKKKLKDVGEKTKVALIYNNLKSNPNLPNLNELEMYNEVEGKYSFAHFENTKYILFEEGNNTYALGIDLTKQHSFPTLPLSIAGLVSLLLLKIAYGAVRRLFRPLERIKEGAQHFASGNFDHQIPVKGKGQLADLTISINEMGKNIQLMLESKRELLLAIAHELRTPITRAKLHLELLENSNRKENIIYEVDEMSTLVNDLLESEKLKEGHHVLDLEEVALNEFINKILESYKSEDIEVTLNPGSLNIDKIRYSMAIKNILNNALFYGKGHAVNIVQTKTFIEISNQGETIPECEIEKITDAFYRADKSRVRREDGGGVGLGLYLVDRVLYAHGHRLAISSKNQLTSFKIFFS